MGTAVHSADLPDNPDDGHVKIIFTENDLEAYGDFVPAIGNGRPLTDDYVRKLLHKMNIIHGIQEEAVRDAVAACMNSKKIQKNILIARGTPAENEITEYFQLNPALGRGQAPEPENKIDHRQFTPFTIVKKSQALAKQKSRKPGAAGMNVHGGTLPFKVLKPNSVEPGENTVLDGKFMLAAIDGQMIIQKNIISVKESLHIRGPVGYSTGHINFPGDILIEGPVSDGFKIHSGGSVTIKQTFDVTEAITKGNLYVAGGIIGRGAALLKVGGGIKTRFIENCRAACRRTVSVDSEIINSHIYTLEKVEMGDRGMIIGGEILAVQGVFAGGIGKKSARAASIKCGIDFTAEQEKEKNNNMLRLLTAKLERLNQLLEEPGSDPEKKLKLEELHARLTAEQRAALDKVNELSGRININENAVVEVTGEIAAGTVIEICHAAYFVTEPIKKVRIFLDKERGKLATAPLT
ncbi:MAG: FapA family protein [Treponema sp.]|nr:FapA family protein [Treponema sp.]